MTALQGLLSHSRTEAMLDGQDMALQGPRAAGTLAGPGTLVANLSLSVRARQQEQMKLHSVASRLHMVQLSQCAE